MKEAVKNIIDNDGSVEGKSFTILIQVLIVISLLSFSISTIPNLSKSTIRVLQLIEVMTVVLFSMEYCLRIYIADKKLSYIFSFWGLIDLIAILPFYLASGLDLRAVRIFRLLRIFRIFKLLRYTKAINRIGTAFTMVKEELILFFFVAMILLFLSSVGIYYFEHEAQPEKFKSVFHSLWWASATLTTVGYGDIYPVTKLGKIFTFFVLMIGIGIVSVPTGLIASALSKARIEEDLRD